LQIFSGKAPLPYSAEMQKAARIMEKSISTIREYQKNAGIKKDEIADPNCTGLIGQEYTELTTTLGDLPAKRTTTNPNFAALIVFLLDQLGVSPGNTVAIGCSASFPALMIASLSATQAMDVHPIPIISLGSSSFGANNPEFNLLHIYDLLLEKGIFKTKPAAISLGGEKDIGEEFSSELKNRLVEQIRTSDIPFIYEPNFQKNIEARKKIYQFDPIRGRVVAFINIGGSYINMGQSERALQLNPGINESGALPQAGESGVIFKMLEKGVPVIHLLYIKGLALKYGLSWDPIPLPGPGEDVLCSQQSDRDYKFWVISIGYLVGLGVITILSCKRKIVL